MKRLTLIWLAVALLVCRCRNEEPSSNATPQVKSSKPIALAITHDVSKTFQHIPAPDERLLREWAKYVASTGGRIAFGLIGTPDSTGLLVRESFGRMSKSLENPTYLDQIAFDHSMDSVRQANALLIESFVMESLSLLQKHRHHQHTDVNGRFRAVATYFLEPGMDAYEPYYFTATDGLQDVVMPPFTIDTVLQPNLLPPSITVMTCGWKNPIYGPQWRRLESPQALVAVLQSFTHKHR